MPTLRPPRLALHIAAAVAGMTFATIAVARIHVRVQTTLSGYEIGHLKSEEARLLEQRSALKMQLAKLTSKKHLMLMSSSGREGKELSHGTLALR